MEIICIYTFLHVFMCFVAVHKCFKLLRDGCIMMGCSLMMIC